MPDAEGEEINLASDSEAYLFLPEALEYAFSVVNVEDLPSPQAPPNQASALPYPKTYAEAMTRPDAAYWHESACKEIDALVENGTWMVAKLPPGKKAIGSR